MTQISQFYSDIVQEVMSRQKNKWDYNGIYGQIRLLEIDSRGEVGELLVEKLLQSMGIEVERNGETDRTRKHWDIRDKTHNLDFEVKLATQGGSRTYQYEGFERDRDYAGVILIGVSPNQLFLTCAAKAKMPFNAANDFYTKEKKKMHHRGHGIQYKWTLSQADVDAREVKTPEDFYNLYRAMIDDIRG